MLFPSHPTNGLTPLVIDPAQPGDHLAHWQELARAAIDPNPFFGPEFLVPFLSHMTAPEVRLCVLTEAESGRWMMAAPVARKKVGLLVPAATLFVTEYGPLGVPLMQSDAGIRTADVFLQLTARTAGMPLVAMPYMPVDSTSARILAQSDAWTMTSTRGGERAAHDSGLAGEAQFAAAFSGKRRKELPRQMRRLADHGPVELLSHSGPDTPRLFETFLDLEAKGWKGRAGTALKSNPETLKFARAMIAARASKNGVRIDTLSAGGDVIGLLVILREGARAFSWKIAYNEDYARYSPGAQIALYALERNLNDSQLAAGADSLAIPGHPMIAPLWRGSLRTATLLFATSLPGRILQAAARVDVNMEQSGRSFARSYLKRKTAS